MDVCVYAFACVFVSKRGVEREGEREREREKKRERERERDDIDWTL